MLTSMITACKWVTLKAFVVMLLRENAGMLMVGGYEICLYLAWLLQYFDTLLLEEMANNHKSIFLFLDKVFPESSSCLRILEFQPAVSLTNSRSTLIVMALFLIQ